MKFTFSKFKKDLTPSLKSLRPPIFDIETFWFMSLSIGFIIFLVTALVGFKFLYDQYFGNYKISVPSENYENIINIKSLESAINKRNTFVNQETLLPRDPSL
ncbi:MAG: hypothetical protein AAB446_01670 [Patescibacteria group bacterium]